jgi:hypothetical protein
MDRRDVLKTMSLSLGYVIATPSLLKILSSCETRNNIQWKLQFLSTSQGFVVAHLTDLILPSSNTLGAKDVQIPQFIDLILKDLIPKNEKEIFLKGSLVFHLKFKKLFKKDVLKGSKKEFSALLSAYFNITSEKQNHIFEFLRTSEEDIIDTESYYIYKYLIFIRYYSLFGYFTSKRVGTEILNYDPIPGSFEACIPVLEVGNVSSI